MYTPLITISCVWYHSCQRITSFQPHTRPYCSPLLFADTSSFRSLRLLSRTNLCFFFVSMGRAHTPVHSISPLWGKYLNSSKCGCALNCLWRSVVGFHLPYSSVLNKPREMKSLLFLNYQLPFTDGSSLWMFNFYLLYFLYFLLKYFITALAASH